MPIAEFTDAEVFGQEMSDADVFGQSELSDSDVGIEETPGALGGAANALRRGVKGAQLIAPSLLLSQSPGGGVTAGQAFRGFQQSMDDPRYMESLLAAGEDPAQMAEAESLFGPRRRAEGMAAQKQAIRDVWAGVTSEMAGEREAIPKSQAQQELAQARTAGDKWTVFRKYPGQVVSSIVLESLPPSIAGAAVGGATGGPAGMAAGVGLSSAAMEFSNEFLSEAARQGFEPEDPAQLSRFLDSPGYDAALNRALTRASIVGGVDAATAGAAGRFIAPALKTGLKNVIVATGKEIGQQAVGGAGGELLAQAATKQGEPLDWFDIAMEGVAEIATGPAEAYGNIRAGLRERPQLTPGLTSDNPQVAAIERQLNAPDRQVVTPDALAELEAAMRGNQVRPSQRPQPEPMPAAPEPVVIRETVGQPVTEEDLANREYMKRLDEGARDIIQDQSKSYERMSKDDIDLLAALGDEEAKKERRRRRMQKPAEIEQKPVMGEQIGAQGEQRAIDFVPEKAPTVPENAPIVTPEPAGQPLPAVPESPPTAPETITGPPAPGFGPEKQGENEEKASVMPAETGETPAPVRSARRRGSNRPPDIIDHIQNTIGKIKSISAIKEGNESLYDAAKEIRQYGAARKILSSASNAIEPDVALQSLINDRFLPEGSSVDDFWDAIADAAKGRQGDRKTTTREQQVIETEERQHLDFVKAGIKRRLPGVAVTDLIAGDKFTLNGVEVRVQDFDLDENGDVIAVIIDDGRRYGTQRVGADEIIRPDKGSLQHTQEVGFAPEGIAESSTEPEKEAPRIAQSDTGFSLAAPESVDEQQARSEREAQEAERKRQREAIEERAAKPLIGKQGDIGQGDLLGGGDLFSAPAKPKDAGAEKLISQLKQLRAQVDTMEQDLRGQGVVTKEAPYNAQEQFDYTREHRREIERAYSPDALAAQLKEDLLDLLDTDENLRLKAQEAYGKTRTDRDAQSDEWANKIQNNYINGTRRQTVEDLIQAIREKEPRLFGEFDRLTAMFSHEIGMEVAGEEIAALDLEDHDSGEVISPQYLWENWLKHRPEVYDQNPQLARYIDQLKNTSEREKDYAPDLAKLSEAKQEKDAIERALDQLKIDVPPGVQAFGIVPDLWNRVIEIVRAAYRAGKSIAQAIEDGIAHLRENHKGRLDENQVRKGLERVLKQDKPDLIRERIRPLEKRMEEHEAKGEPIPQELLDEYKSVVDELGEEIRAGRSKMGAERARVDDDLQKRERPKGPQEPARIPPWKGEERLPAGNHLRQLWTALKNWRERTGNWLSRRNARMDITVGRDAGDNRAARLANEASLHVRLLLNRAFGDTGKAVRAKNQAREAALTFVVEADGDRAALQDMWESIANSPAAETTHGKRAMAAIEYANTNWEKLEKAAEEYKKLTTIERETELNEGVNSAEWKGGYVYHRWKREKVSGSDPTKPQPAGTPFRKPRSVETYAEGIAGGRDPVTLNGLELLAERVHAGQRKLNELRWVHGLRNLEDPVTKAPVVVDAIVKHRRPVGLPTPENAEPSSEEYNEAGFKPERLVTAPEGYTVWGKELGLELAVHNSFAGLLTKLTSPSFFKNAPAKKVFGAIKSALLLFDTFHLGRMAAWRQMFGLGGGYRKGQTLLDFSTADIREMAERGEIPKDWAAGLVENKRRLELAVDTGYNVGNVLDNSWGDLLHSIPGIGHFNKWLFGQYQRGAMAESWLIEFERMRKALPNSSERAVARRVSRDLNNRFGNLGRQGLFKSRTAQDLARFVFLAPQWNEALIRSELGAGKQTLMAPIESVQQRRLVAGTLMKATGTMALGTFLANQILNWAFRGKPTWDNDEEGWDKKISAYIPDAVSGGPGFFLNPLALPAEYTHLVEGNLHRSGGDMAETAKRILNSRLHSVSRAAFTLFTRQDALGRKLREGEVFPAMAKAMAPIPIAGPTAFNAAKQAITGEPSETYPGQYQKQLMASFGVKTDQAPPAEQRIRSLARDFNKAAGITPSAEFYGGDFDDLNKALRIGNMSDARDAMEEILKKKTANQIAEHYERTVRAPFTGQLARESQFYRSLTDEQRERYLEAKQARRDLAIEARKLLRDVVMAGR